MLELEYYLDNSKKRFTSIVSMMERIQKGSKVDVKEAVTFGNIDDSILDILDALNILHHWDELPANMDITEGYFKTLVDRYKTLRKNEETKFTDYIPVLNDFIKAINGFKSMDIGWLYGRSFSRDKFYRCFDGDMRLSMGSYQKICESIDHSSEFNVLEINGDNLGKSMIHIKDYFPMTNLYEIVNSEYQAIAPEDRKRFKRFLSGGLRNCKCSNDVFNMVIVTPRFDAMHVVNNLGTVSHQGERTILDRAYSYLRKDGLLVYVTPVAMISKSIASYISRNLREISIIRDVEERYNGLVAILGKKVSPLERGVDPKTYALLRNLVSNIELIDEPEKRSYTLSSGVTEVQRFRSNVLDDTEMLALFNQSNAVKEFWDAQKVPKISDQEVHPLLPFNVGQLGLILTSGCLDGVIEEPGNCSHAVRGRVVKTTDSYREFNNDGSEVQITSTTSNRVEISMFLPDGTYKCLA